MGLLGMGSCFSKNTAGVFFCQVTKLINAMGDMADILSLNQFFRIKEIPHSIPHHLKDKRLGASPGVVLANILNILIWN